jgi:hypothetical protein
MKLFANGCSFTFGGGLCNQFDTDHKGQYIFVPGSSHPKNIEREKVVWPSHLGKLLDADEVVNLSIGAGSNSRIVRTTLDFFMEKLSQGADVTEYLAVIEWTDISRHEYSAHGQWWLCNNNGVANDTGYKSGTLPPGPIPSQQVQHTEYFYKHQYHEWQDVTDAVMHITALGGFFEKFKIPYVFWCLNGLHYEQITHDKQFESFKYLLPMVEKFTWLGGTIDQSRFSGFGEYDSECFVSPTDGHPNRLGHQKLAKNIHQLMCKIPGLLK